LNHIFSTKTDFFCSLKCRNMHCYAKILSGKFCYYISSYPIFAQVKPFLKYCLILLALAGFLASAFEVNNEEFKQNFKKESYSYIIAAKSGAVHDFHLDHPVALPVNLIFQIAEEKFIQQQATCSFFTDPDPPNKLYIRNSVFRI